MTKTARMDSLDPNDPNLEKDDGGVSVAMAVQGFDEDFSGIEALEEVNAKTIAYMEKIIRKSYEYKSYINYLKQELDITRCAITPGLNQKDLSFGLEFHHYPITLYDAVDTLTRYEFAHKGAGNLSMFDVMKTVMKEHYEGNIGLVPLSTTAHEMAHSGAIRIPASAIHGNYGKFIEKYHDYMTPELIDKCETAALITDELAEEQNSGKLGKSTLNYSVEYNAAGDEPRDVE